MIIWPQTWPKLESLRMSIWVKIVGLLLKDTNMMVKIPMAIEREVDDALNIREVGVKVK